MTFLSSKITVLKTFLLLLFAMLLLMLLYYFLVLAETNFSSSRGGKVDLISLPFLPLLILKFVYTCTFGCTFTFRELFSSYCYCFYFSRPFSLLCLFYYLLLARLRGKLTNIPNWSMAGSASQLIADFCFRISIRKTTILNPIGNQRAA